jgi:hypothetical protein
LPWITDRVAAWQFHRAIDSRISNRALTEADGLPLIEVDWFFWTGPIVNL